LTSWLEVARSVFVFVSSSTLVSDCLIKYISIVCCFVVAMPSVKRETERKVNAPVDTGPSPNSDERVNNPTEGANEPTRESGSSVFVFVSSSTLVSDCLIKYISIVCCFVVAMPSVKRETERKVNAPVDTGPSPNSDERVNNPTEGANEPTRESGSLQCYVTTIKVT
ncbi:hypothetical protein T08_9211, partial [Trichinella sp. T8]